MIGPGDERARPPEGAGFTDAVTFAFAEATPRGLAGFLRAGIAAGPDGERSGSLLAVLFDGDATAAAVAHGTVPLDADADWARLELPGAVTTVLSPLARWSVAFGEAGGAGFALEFQATGPPAEQAADDDAALLGGMVGYEQLCVVQGTVRIAGRDRTVRCLGQRGHAWGAPDWERIEGTRTITAWLQDGTAYTLSSVRPAGARGHDADAVWGAVLAPEPAPIAAPRVSTTWDAEGRQRRAGLELWLREDDDYPARLAGEVRVGSTLDLGRLRLDCSMFTWTADGRRGVGRYDVLRRA